MAKLIQNDSKICFVLEFGTAIGNKIFIFEPILTLIKSQAACRIPKLSAANFVAQSYAIDKKDAMDVVDYFYALVENAPVEREINVRPMSHSDRLNAIA